MICLELTISFALGGELPSIDTPLKTGAVAPDDAALVVGIEDYAFINDVPFASRDASAMYGFLVYTRGVPSSRVHLLDGGANRENLLAAAKAARADVAPGGTLWVYFAGHGAASPTTGDRMLLGDDVRPDAASFEARSVPLAELRGLIEAPEHQTVMLLDSCYAGKGRTGEEVVPGGRFAIPSFAVPPNEVVAEWTASAANEIAGPLQAARHGAFTYLALGALRGWADGELSGVRDGTVTAEEAFLYVRNALGTLQLRDQTPVWSGTERSGLVLVASERLEAPPALDALPVPVTEMPVTVAPVATVVPVTIAPVAETSIPVPPVVEPVSAVDTPPAPEGTSRYTELTDGKWTLPDAGKAVGIAKGLANKPVYEAELARNFDALVAQYPSVSAVRFDGSYASQLISIGAVVAAEVQCNGHLYRVEVSLAGDTVMWGTQQEVARVMAQKVLRNSPCR